MNDNNHKIDHKIDLARTLIKDGPNFCSHRLTIEDQTAYLKPTMSSMFFCYIYIVVGLFLFALASHIFFNVEQIDLAIFLGGFGIAITTFGMTLIKPFMKRAIFDKSQGVFINNNDRPVKFKNLSSLQITNKIVLRKQGLNYPCYELNILTVNGRRINILNHNNIDQILVDAKKLETFLPITVLDLRREIKVSA